MSAKSLLTSGRRGGPTAACPRKEVERDEQDHPSSQSCCPSLDRRPTRGGTVGFHDDLAGVAAEAEMLRRATRRAGSRELAEDALQETVRAITERKSSEVIANLRGFFSCR